MTDRPEPLRVTLPDDVECSLCSRLIPDGESYDSSVIGSPTEEECFLVLVCERCQASNMVLMVGGDA